MKKNLLTIIILAISVLLLAVISCNKMRLNFDKLTTIEGSGEWSLPIIDDKSSIEHILSQLDENGYIIIQDDGKLKFCYEVFQDNIIRAEEFLCFDNYEYDEFFSIENPIPYVLPEPQTIELPQLVQTISLQSETMEVRNAVIKSGTIHLELIQNIGQINTIRIGSSNFVDNYGDSLQLEFTDNSINVSFDVSGYHFISDQNNNLTLSISCIITTQGTTNPYLNINSKIDINNFCLKEVQCLLAPFTETFSHDTTFNMFSNNFQGNINIFDPKLRIYTENRFEVDGSFYIDTAAFTSPGLEASLLLNGPTLINIPIGYYEQAVENVNNIYFDTRYNKFTVIGLITLNPDGFSAGVLNFNEESSLDVKAATEIPFDFYIGYAYYRDTVDFILEEIVKTDLLEDITFKIIFSHDLPLNFSTQIYSYNKNTGQISDSLFASQEIIQGSFDGNIVKNDPVYVVFKKDQIHNLLNANQLILSFRLNTDDPLVQEHISLYENQFLQTEISLRLVYDGVLITF